MKIVGMAGVRDGYEPYMLAGAMMVKHSWYQVPNALLLDACRRKSFAKSNWC